MRRRIVWYFLKELPHYTAARLAVHPVCGKRAIPVFRQL